MLRNQDHEFTYAGGKSLFGADCPIKRAAFITDMILWDAEVKYLHVNLCVVTRLSNCVVTCSSFRPFR